MANTTVARPYAKAAFEYALHDNALNKWSEMINFASFIVEDKLFNTLLNHPKVPQLALAEIIFDLDKKIDRKIFTSEGENFIHLLAQEKRLEILPEITKLFEKFKAEQEQSVTAEVISAFPLNEEMKKEIAVSLTKRLQREVSLVCSVNSELLGGAIIKVGDFVIDGSVSGKLAKMANLFAS
ncbi:MAG: ATP synthase subunit delta [Legionellaceae bacterium]